MSKAFIFPGQGSQFVGMGKDLADAFPAAREVFEEVDDSLSQKLSSLMFEGPEDDLTMTENTQPALMAVSMAVVRVLEKEAKLPLGECAAYVAGHSLGEYSALAAAGALTLEDTARLLRLRGRAMQRAVPIGEGAMAALLGVDIDAAGEITEQAADGQVCTTANDNGPGQVVISGHRAAVERAMELAAQKGARKSVLLPVSAPFHCELMAPAAEEMKAALAETAVKTPVVPLISNITADPVTDPGDIKERLVQQVTGTVRWRESVETMLDRGADHFIEAGAGRVLTGLVRRINRDVAATALQTPDDIENFLNAI